MESNSWRIILIFRLMRLFCALLAYRSNNNWVRRRTLTRLFAAGAGILKACAAQGPRLVVERCPQQCEISSVNTRHCMRPSADMVRSAEIVAWGDVVY